MLEYFTHLRQNAETPVPPTVYMKNQSEKNAVTALSDYVLLHCTSTVRVCPNPNKVLLDAIIEDELHVRCEEMHELHCRTERVKICVSQFDAA